MEYLINKKIPVIVGISAFINLILVLIFEPFCPWKMNFDIDCAGCGATRMVKALFKLDFYQAFRFNPLMFCLLIIGTIYIVYLLISKVRHRKYYKIKSRDLLILLIVIVLFTILRNIPMFYYLKPTIVS